MANKFTKRLTYAYETVRDESAYQAKKMFQTVTDPNSAIVSFLTSNGIAGFKFHVPQTEQVKFESEITDYYTDLNSCYQDNIALKPITITVTGLQGEYFYDLHPIENVVSTVSTTIGLINAFLPQLTNVVDQVKNVMLKQQEQQSKEDATSTVTSLLSGKISKNKYKINWDGLKDLNYLDLWYTFQQLFKLKSAQTRAFLYFEALWQGRCMFSVETSWQRFDNMVIQSLTPMRDNNADITDFSITFKQLQFAETLTKDIRSMNITELDKLTATERQISKGKEVKVK